jgi:hypothetical protein
MSRRKWPFLNDLEPANERRPGPTGFPLAPRVSHAPQQGPAFFNDCGWTPIDVRSMLQTVAELKRLPLLMRLFALFPDPKGTKPKQIWDGVVQLEKK